MNGDTMLKHVDILVSLGLTVSHVKTMGLQQPMVLHLNLATVKMTEKWKFLTRIMTCDLDTLAACPRMLSCSLHNVLGP